MIDEDISPDKTIGNNEKTIESNEKTIEGNEKTIENNEKTMESNEKTIKWHEKMIEKAREDIRYRKNEILRLQGKTEVCPHCMGEGRIMTVHRFSGPHKYMTCPTCSGNGKISIDELEEYNKVNREQIVDK